MIEVRELEAGGHLRFSPRRIAPGEAEELFDRLHREVPWSARTIRIAGREVREPRLTAWYGDPEAAYTYSGLSLQPLAWTPLLLALCARVEEAAESPFNSVLVNLYRDEHDSMGLHADKEPELGRDPVIASLSLGATRRFVLRYARRDRAPPPVELELAAGTLVVMGGTTQHFWKHGVPKERTPVGPRINLTFRRIVAAARA